MNFESCEMTENGTGGGEWWRPSRGKPRDVILFTAGLAGLVNEALREDVPRQALLVVYVAMMLGPSFLAWFGGGGGRNGRR
jgi:hypothetical protein